MGTTTSPDYSGISVKIDAAPNLTPAGNPSEIGHLEDINPIIDKSRSVKKYDPINDKTYEQVVALGVLTYGAFSAKVLYDPRSNEGINKIEHAIDTNEAVEITIELNDSKGSNGTIIKQLCKISKFSVTGERDGKLMADVGAERIGTTSITPAA